MAFSYLKTGLKNDKDILGSYPELKSFQTSPEKQDLGLIDSCCLAQALGGTHQNKGVSFINETATFKPIWFAAQ